MDEIQAAPSVLASLRYFYEELPQLHIMCAGSLLEFALEHIDFSMPVGRIEYMYLGPMNFEEFLAAVDEQPLVDFLNQYQLGDEYPHSIHTKLMSLLKIYCVTGGMPEAVMKYVTQQDFLAIDRIKRSILETYQDDFSKYCKNKEENRIRDVFEKIPLFIGKKIKYSEINPSFKSTLILSALKKLNLSKVIHLVYHSASNGVPLGAEINEKIFKPLFLDVGLLAKQVNLSLLDFNDVIELNLVNRGIISEQFIGQHLLFTHPSFEPPHVYYWQREKKSSQAEVDYVISQGQNIIPIEVKAGKTGTLRSLHTFMQEKKLPIGVRFYSEQYQLVQHNKEHSYAVLSLPLYMVQQLPRLMKLAKKPAPQS